MHSLWHVGSATLGISLSVLGACGDDDNTGYGTEADRIGVGAQCRSDADCLQGPDGGIHQTCLTEFKGGYCGLRGCVSTMDCPYGSICVTYDNGQNYCFRECSTKSECNLNRSSDVASNCSSSVDFVDAKSATKACIPPSSG